MVSGDIPIQLTAGKDLSKEATAWAHLMGPWAYYHLGDFTRRRMINTAHAGRIALTVCAREFKRHHVHLSAGSIIN